MKRSITVVVMLVVWASLIVVAATKLYHCCDVSLTKNRIPNPYQDSR